MWPSEIAVLSRTARHKLGADKKVTYYSDASNKKQRKYAKTNKFSCLL